MDRIKHHRLISVITPVYNAARCLTKCLDSLLSQKEQNFEILLIDDGSTDSSGEICDIYALKDDRIRVFHKPNGGVSSARNVGLEQATGEWIAFVDADDEVTDDYLTIPSDFSDCDIIQKGFIEIDENGERSQRVENRIIRNRKDIYDFFVFSRTNALWDKLIKRSSISRHKFDKKIRIGEDFIFFLQILENINGWGFSNVGMYRYWHHSSSAMRQITPEERLNLVLNQIDNIKSVINSSTIPKELQHQIIAHTYLPHIWHGKSMLTHDSVTRVNKIIHELPFNQLRNLPVKSIVKYLFLKGFIEFKSVGKS